MRSELITCIMLFSFRQFFLAWVFVLCCGCSSFIFFLCLSKKINVLQVCRLTKTMTKKTGCNTAEGLVRWVCVSAQAFAVPVGRAAFCLCVIATDDVFGFPFSKFQCGFVYISLLCPGAYVQQKPVPLLHHCRHSINS
jgi:hypothetical protein